MKTNNPTRGRQTNSQKFPPLNPFLACLFERTRSFGLWAFTFNSLALRPKRKRNLKILKQTTIVEKKRIQQLTQNMRFARLPRYTMFASSRLDLYYTAGKHRIFWNVKVITMIKCRGGFGYKVFRRRAYSKIK